MAQYSKLTKPNMDDPDLEIFGTTGIPPEGERDADACEAYGAGMGDCALLPCTEGLFNQAIIDIAEIPQIWKTCTVYVVEREGFHYMCASAGGDLGYNVGDTFTGYHDQTGKPFGSFKVANVVKFNKGRMSGKRTEVGLDGSLGLLVFK